MTARKAFAFSILLLVRLVLLLLFFFLTLSLLFIEPGETQRKPSCAPVETCGR